MSFNKLTDPLSPTTKKKIAVCGEIIEQSVKFNWKIDNFSELVATNNVGGIDICQSPQYRFNLHLIELHLHMSSVSEVMFQKNFSIELVIQNFGQYKEDKATSLIKITISILDNKNQRFWHQEELLNEVIYRSQHSILSRSFQKFIFSTEDFENLLINNSLIITYRMEVMGQQIDKFPYSFDFLSDIILKSKNNSHFRAHGVILAAASNVLKNLIVSKNEEFEATSSQDSSMNQIIIDLPHLEDDILKDLLDYIYTGGLKNFNKIKVAAKDLGILSLFRVE